MASHDSNNDFRSALLARSFKAFLQSLISSAIVLIVLSRFVVYWVLLIAACSALLAFLSGLIFGVPEAESAGTLYIDTSDVATDRYLIDFDSIEGLKDKKKVQIKIRTDRHLEGEVKYVGE